MLKKIFITSILCFLVQGLTAMGRKNVNLKGTNLLLGVSHCIYANTYKKIAPIKTHAINNINLYTYKPSRVLPFKNKEKFINNRSIIFPIIIGTGAISYGGYNYWSINNKKTEKKTTVEKCDLRDENLNQKQSKSKVRLMHRIGRGGNIDSVRKHGLLTCKELYRKGLTTFNPSQVGGVMCNQYDVIYFAYSGDMGSIKDTNYVEIEVDPKTTYVYNREYRFFNKPGLYQGSKVLLSTYIANKEKAERMRREAPPGQAVIFNPRTSEPFYVSYSDTRYYSRKRLGLDIDGVGNSIYQYLGEIIFYRNNIPSEELIFPGEIISSDSVNKVHHNDFFYSYQINY